VCLCVCVGGGGVRVELASMAILISVKIELENRSCNTVYNKFQAMNKQLYGRKRDLWCSMLKIESSKFRMMT
jgi:hypothetical protein